MLTTEKLEECKIDLTQIFMAIHTTDRIHYLRQFDSVFKVLSDLQKKAVQPLRIAPGHPCDSAA